MSRAAVWGSSVGGAYALATAALLPEAIASVCVFAPLGPYGAPGLDFTEGMSDGFREEIRVFWTIPAGHGPSSRPGQRSSHGRRHRPPGGWTGGQTAPAKMPPTARRRPTTWPW